MRVLDILILIRCWGKYYQIFWFTDGSALTDEGFGPLIHIYATFRWLGGSWIVKIVFIVGVAVEFTEEERNGDILKNMIHFNFQV